MSRTQAARKVKRREVWKCVDPGRQNRTRQGCKLPGGHAAPCPDHLDARLVKRWVIEQVRAGMIDWPAVLVDLDTKEIGLRGGAADEARTSRTSLVDRW